MVALGMAAALGVAVAGHAALTPLRWSYGGTGGSPAQVRCPARSYVAGLRVFLGETSVAGVALLCRADAGGALREGELLGAHSERDDTLRCDAGSVGVGIWGSSGSLVDRISLMCASRAALAGPVSHLRAAGGAGGDGFRAWCPRGRALTGLEGAAGTLLDRVAPVCGAAHE